MLTIQIGGILCGDYIRLPHSFLYVFVATTIVIVFWVKNNTITALFLIASLFIASTFLIQRDTIPFSPDKIYSIEGRCEEMMNKDNYILSAHGQLFYLRNEDTTVRYRIGDSLSFQAKIYSTLAANNQNNSNYNKYLRQHGIDYKVFPNSPIRQQGHSTNLYSSFQQLRTIGIKKLDRHLLDTTNSALLKALCLGYKYDLSPDTKALFSSTGTVHLLAVSGLHTGIIYAMIILLCRFLRVRNRYRYVFALPLLWGYACLTGLSPSVIRAALIFTLLDVAKIFQRDYTPLNTIGATAFFTLLFYPHTLFSLSFQMSYAAYSGIILFLAIIPEKLNRKKILFSYLLLPIGITLAAQLATAPISIYNFHTLPVTGFIANLVAVPFATIILYCGVIFLLLPDVLCSFCAAPLNYICELFTQMLKRLNDISIQLTDLYPTVPILILTYIVLILIYSYLQKRRLDTFIGINVVLCAIIIYSSTINHMRHNSTELIIFHLYRKTTILLNHNGHYCLIPSDTTTPNSAVSDYILRNRLRQLPEHNLFVGTTLSRFENLLITHNDTISIVSTATSPIPDSGTLIITNNITPEKISALKTKRPSRIILDDSNNFYCIRAWELFANSTHIELNKTRQSGHITLKIK